MKSIDYGCRFIASCIALSKVDYGYDLLWKYLWLIYQVAKTINWIKHNHISGVYNHYRDVTWATWHLKSTISPRYIQQFIRINNNRKLKLRIPTLYEESPSFTGRFDTLRTIHTKGVSCHDVIMFRWRPDPVLHGPLTRYVKLRVAHAPGMPGTFSSPPTSKETSC